MGWEERNGHQYFYHKVRIGRKVRSEYCGSGEAGHFMHEMVAGDPLQDLMESEMNRSEREYEDEIVRRIDACERAIQQCVVEGLVNCGFHKHKGQWRRRRDEAT